jgi:hypothetical protein
MEESGIERVIEKAVNGMRNEMSTVLWRIERSRDGSPEALRKMLKNGLEAMVGAVEKVMYGVSDGLAKEWKDKKRDEEEMIVRSDMENKEREDRYRKEEIRLRNLEKRMDRESKENEEMWKEKEGRIRSMVERLEREVSRMSEQGRSDGGGGIRKDVNDKLDDRIRAIEEKFWRLDGRTWRKETEILM